MRLASFGVLWISRLQMDGNVYCWSLLLPCVMDDKAPCGKRIDPLRSGIYVKCLLSVSCTFHSILNGRITGTSLRTYFHTISISINWVFFSALRIVPAQISRKFWRIQSPICTCICIQFIWQISCDALYAQWIRCYSLSSVYLFHILSKLGNVQVCPIAVKRRFWSLKKFAHWRWWS